RARLAQTPDDPQALSALAEALTVEAGGTVTPDALNALNKALAKNPDDPRTLFYLGLHEAQSGDSAAALKRWRALEARSPPEAHVRQVPPGGAVPPAAVAVLQRLEKAEPGNGLALFYLGAADFAAGHKPEAARRWKTLLSLLPPDAPIRGMLEQKIKEAE